MIASALLPLFLVSAQPPAAEAPLPFSPARTSPVQAEEAESNWSGSISAGGIIRTGNNKTRTANATAAAVWKKNKDRLTLGALWSYSDQDRIVTQRKVYGAAKYDRFLSEKTFAYAQASGDADKDAGLKLRSTVGVGLGRQFADDETWKFSAEAGISAVSEDFKISGKKEYLSGRAAYNAAYNHSDSWAFTQDVEVFPSLEDGDDVYVRADTRAVLTLTEAMFAQFQWVMDYDNTPDTGNDRLDHLFAVTVGWSF